MRFVNLYHLKKIIFLPLFFLLPLFVFPDCRPEPSTLPPFETRYEIPPNIELKEILLQPQLLEDRTYRDEFNQTDMLHAIGDVHALYPLPLKDIIPVLEDLENQDEFMPTVKKSKELCYSPGNPAYYRYHLHIVYRVIFFTADYNYILHLFVETPGPFDNGTVREYRSRFTLAKSLDEKNALVRGSWYAKQIHFQGDPHTYIRYFARTAFKEEFTGLETGINIAAGKEFKNTLNSLYEESKRRLELRN